jgi:hypothetical protein
MNSVLRESHAARFCSSPDINPVVDCAEGAPPEKGAVSIPQKRLPFRNERQ